MIQSYKTKSVCVVDFGLFVELAVELTQWFGEVHYFYPWQGSAFPKSNQELVGHGLPGVKNVKWFWDMYKDVDLFIFPDIYMGDFQERLIGEGKRVWGSRRGDELEYLRAKSKGLFKRLGLPVGPFEVIKGLDDLRLFLRENDNQHVKCELNRGDFETFKAPNYKLVEGRLDSLRTHPWREEKDT